MSIPFATTRCSPTTEELIDEHLRAGPVNAAYDGHLWVRAIKMYADGALGSRGAALLAPYSRRSREHRTGLERRGAHCRPSPTKALRAGFQVCVHAIGDRGNRIVLDAYEGALRAVPVDRSRGSASNTRRVLALEDIPRFAKLGIIPSMQTTHQISDMDWAQARLGPDRVLGAYAWRSLARHRA